MLENLTSNIVISEAVALMSVVLTKEDKHVSNGELVCTTECIDRLCGLVVRVSGYRYRGLGFDSRRYQIF